jgi:ABC-type methionine transport system ATPase subunit
MLVKAIREVKNVKLLINNMIEVILKIMDHVVVMIMDGVIIKRINIEDMTTDPQNTIIVGTGIRGINGIDITEEIITNIEMENMIEIEMVF